MFHVEHLLADINHDWVFHVEHGEALFHMNAALPGQRHSWGNVFGFPRRLDCATVRSGMFHVEHASPRCFAHMPNNGTRSSSQKERNQLATISYCPPRGAFAGNGAPKWALANPKS